MKKLGRVVESRPLLRAWHPFAQFPSVSSPIASSAKWNHYDAFEAVVRTDVISKVVPAPEPKAAPSLNRPKTPPPAPATAPVPVHVTPPPVPLPLLTQSTVSPALMASPSPAISGAGSSKAPVRSVVTETVSTYVIRDEWGNQIWICPGCDKPDDGSPMIGCDDCDDWYHWSCVGLMTAPPEEMQWFCNKCANKKKDKKHKKRKHRAH
ncbi:Transcription initiation factor TFIID subunit 3 [Pteropus alecto]|uniref:Transcription initiation factor TFIID subunit 3 n=1 Tax=Pteropus alecto TaxID=9402 RepID=L5KZM6_PTEAL|nr:Transcription initiation factor TFIID subunit 3 [Pteropus alecto]